MPKLLASLALLEAAVGRQSRDRERRRLSARPNYRNIESRDQEPSCVRGAAGAFAPAEPRLQAPARSVARYIRCSPGPACRCVRQGSNLGPPLQRLNCLTSMNSRTSLQLLLLSLTLASCAVTKGPDAGAPLPVDRANLPFSSPECLAAKLPSGEAFPASAIPAAALANRQSGLVAIRYDVIAGVAVNLQVVSSSPAGLYDAAAMHHAAKYRTSTSSTVRGCVTIIEVKF